MANIQQLSFVQLRDLLDNDEEVYEEVCEVIGSTFTWGETDYSLVSPTSLDKAVEYYRLHCPDPDFRKVLWDLHVLLDSLPLGTFVNI